MFWIIMRQCARVAFAFLASVGLLTTLIIVGIWLSLFEMHKRWSFNEAGEYYSPPDAMAQWRDLAETARAVKLAGVVKVGSLSHQGNAWKFLMGSGPDSEIPVSYIGPLPVGLVEGAWVAVYGIFLPTADVDFLAKRVVSSTAAEQRSDQEFVPRQ